MLRLDDYKQDALSCPRCSNCKWVDHVYMRSYRFAKICPINVKFGFNAYSAHGMLDIALALMDGRLDYDSKILDIIYACTLCGACDVRCKRNLNIEVLLTLEALRERCVQDGKGPLPVHKATADRIGKAKNRYGASPQNRLKWLPAGFKVAEKADILYFVGCNSAYTQQELSQATANLLTASGTPFMLLEDEWCCGKPLFSTGQADLAGKLIEHNLSAIERSGAKTVIASCAECYKTLKVDYPKFIGKSTADMGFKVLHITEYLEPLVKSGVLKLKKPVKMRVTYHDSCALGRLSEPWVPWQGVHHKFGILEPRKEFRRGNNGIYEAPREILRSIPGIELVEMERIREHAWCCGAGGEVRSAFKDFALWTVGERLEEANATGAEALVSSCPYCKENMQEAARIGKEKIKVLDIIEVMAQAISKK